MGSESETRFVVAFDGNAGDLNSVLAAVKSSFRTAVSEMQATANKLDLFATASEDGKKLEAALISAKAQLGQFKNAADALATSGFPKAAASFADSIKQAEVAVKAAQAAFDKNQQTLQQYGAALQKGGVDVKNYTAEQVRLAAALKLAAAAAAEQGAKNLLGFQTIKDIQPQINQLNAAFNALVASGKLGFGETSLAAARLEQQVTKLRAETGTLGTAFASVRTSMLAFTVAAVAVGAAVVKTSADYRAFTQGIAAVDTIADASKAQIAQLAAGVRELAKVMGVDAVASTKALYDIIGSGIPTDNSLQVLALATKASVAGITDVTTAAKVGVAVLNAYGLEVNSLERVYDILFRTVRDGVVTFPELAQNIGDVLPSARSAKVPLEEIGAAMIVLTRNGLPASEATTALTRAIQDLAAPAPEAATAMRDLGIEFKGLEGTIKQFAEKSLTLAQLRDLIPDIRAVKGVQILAQNYQLLHDSIGEVSKDTATMQAAYATMAATPQAQVDRFNAALKDLSISIGQFVTSSTSIVQSLTGLLNSFNSLSPSTKQWAIEVGALALGLGAVYLILTKFTVPLNLLGAALFSNLGFLSSFTQGLTLAGLAMGAFQVGVAGITGFELGKWLYGQSTAARFLGDELGITAGRVANVADLLKNKFLAALSGSGDASERATALFLANRDALDSMEKALTSGVTEKLFQLGQQFDALTKRLADATVAAQKAGTDLQSGVTSIAAATKAQLDAVDTSIVSLNSRLATLNAKLAENVAQAQALTQTALSNANAVAAATIAALDKSQAAEITTANKTVEIQKDLAAQRLKILSDGAVEIKKAFEAEAAVRLEIANRTAGNVKQVEQEILLTKKGVLQQIVDAYRAHVNELEAQDQAHLSAIRKLEDERRGIVADVEGKIRELYRDGLTAAQAYADKRLEAEQLLSRARLAITSGDLKTAEELTRRAMSLTDSLGKQVVDGEKVVVTALTARSTATGLYKQEEAILLDIVSKRESAEVKGHDAATASLKTARTELATYSAELKDVTDKAAAGVKLNVTVNSAAAADAIAKLDKSIEERERLVKINADAQLAKLEVERLRDELARGITVNVDARTDKVRDALKLVAAEAPELQLKVDAAIDSIGRVKAAAKEIENVQVQIKTNVEEARKEIQSLQGLDTSSTHTIYVKKVETNAAGGYVGGSSIGLNSVAGYALGGGVFREPSWSKVPGTGGFGDNTPALLREGSFVMKRSASKYYGDAVMGRVAGYAYGGYVGGNQPGHYPASVHTNNAAEVEAYNKQLHAMKVQAEQSFSSIQSRAVNLPRADWGQNVSDYVARVLEIIGYSMDTDEIKSYLDRVLTFYNSFYPALEVARQNHVPAVMGATVQADPDPKTKGKKGDPIPDQNVPFYISAFGGGPGSVSGGSYGPVSLFHDFSGLGGGTPGGMGVYSGYEQGGDVVPAMLEPEEVVIKTPTVRALNKRFGSGFLHAMNAMMLPLDAVAGALAPPRYFSQGGSAGYALSSGAANMPWKGGGDTNININANAGDLLSVENVRRFIVPVLDGMNKRSR